MRWTLHVPDARSEQIQRSSTTRSSRTKEEPPPRPRRRLPHLLCFNPKAWVTRQFLSDSVGFARNPRKRQQLCRWLLFRQISMISNEHPAVWDDWSQKVKPKEHCHEKAWRMEKERMGLEKLNRAHMPSLLPQHSQIVRWARRYLVKSMHIFVSLDRQEENQTVSCILCLPFPNEVTVLLWRCCCCHWRQRFKKKNHEHYNNGAESGRRSSPCDYY